MVHLYSTRHLCISFCCYVQRISDKVGTYVFERYIKTGIAIIKYYKIVNLKISRMQKQKIQNSCFKSTIAVTEVIHTSLIHKYSNNFHFYFSKPINEIVYNDTKSTTNNLLKDIIMISDDTEYLNRIYLYYNSLGKEEIFDRIRLISGFYSDQDMASDYPMNIITNTVKIFKTRDRRLRKMIASDGSSDQTEVQNQNQQSFPSAGFLNSISSLVSQQSLESMFKSVQHKLSFDSTVYDIYQDNAHVFQMSSANKICTQQEASIDHLICDFNDFDAARIISEYTKLLEVRANINKKMSLNSIAQKKPVYQSIILNESKNQEDVKRRKLSRLFSERDGDFRLSKHSKESRNWNIEDPVMEERKITSGEKLVHMRRQQKRTGVKIQDIDQRGWRRQKIRDKAAQLLLKVKSQNYLNGRIDYVEY